MCILCAWIQHGKVKSASVSALTRTDSNKRRKEMLRKQAEAKGVTLQQGTLNKDIGVCTNPQTKDMHYLSSIFVLQCTWHKPISHHGFIKSVWPLLMPYIFTEWPLWSVLWTHIEPFYTFRFCWFIWIENWTDVRQAKNSTIPFKEGMCKYSMCH